MSARPKTSALEDGIGRWLALPAAQRADILAGLRRWALTAGDDAAADRTVLARGTLSSLVADRVADALPLDEAMADGGAALVALLEGLEAAMPRRGRAG